jgi:hypothetical protein
VVGIWYIEFKTLLFASYVTSLEICKNINWKSNITCKHCLETIVESYSCTKMVSLGHPLAHKKAMFMMFLVELKLVIGKTYEMYKRGRCMTP